MLDTDVHITRWSLEIEKCTDEKIKIKIKINNNNDNNNNNNNSLPLMWDACLIMHCMIVTCVHLIEKTLSLEKQQQQQQKKNMNDWTQ